MKIKKITKITLVVIFCLIVIGIIFANIDYSRITDNKRPLLSIYIGKNKNTKADVYYGLGYTIIKCPYYYDNEVRHDDAYKLFLLSSSHVCFYNTDEQESGD